MAKEKPDQATDLISPDKIKKEPDETSTTPASKPLVASRSVSILTSPPNSTGKTSGGQPKTILLVQTVSRTAEIQLLLLPQALRSSRPSTASELILSSSRAKMSAMLTTSSSALKSQPGTTPKIAECFLTMVTAGKGKPVTLPVSRTLQSLQSVKQTSHSQNQEDVKSIVKPTESIPVQSTCQLTFKSRTIKADGTVFTLREYLCNFCQFMVASQDEFREHFMTHIFSCNYCSFRAFTRFEVLTHKKEKHRGIAEELAGYEGLDSFSDQLNSVIGDWNSAEMPKAGSPLPGVSIQVPVVSCPLSSMTIQHSACSATAAETVDSDSSPASIASSKTLVSQPSIETFPTSTPVTVVSTPSLKTSLPVTVATSAVSSMMLGLLAQQKPEPIMPPGTVSSPVVLSTSTIKTPAGIGKSDDNYFTYKVVHDAAGKVQAYECDVCNYRSTKINEIFAHTSTHTLNDLKKSNDNCAQWECFYCTFMSVLQVNVVSHVIAKHPNKPIQLKRMLSDNPTQRYTSRSILFRSPNFTSDATISAKTVSPSTEKERKSDETAMLTTTEPEKAMDDAKDGCMWGCYYCSVQSVDRNEIILHLKKDHATQKLVITRRRITCIPAPQSAKDACRSKAAVESQPSNSEVEKTNGDVQIGDIDSTDPQHSLLKSKRKQLLPCKVPDDLKIDDAIQSDETTKSSFQAVLPFNKCKRRFHNRPKSKEFTDLSELKMSEVVVKRLRSAINVGGSSKRIILNREFGKMVDLTNDLEENTAIVLDGQEVVDDVGMPALEDVSNFTKLKQINRKNSAATKETHFAPDNNIASVIINEMSAENEMPTLCPELSIKKQLLKNKVSKDPESSSSSTGNSRKHPLERASKPVDFPDDFIVSDSQLFLYNSLISEASCRRCSVVISGPSARNHMREHCMSHTGGQLWKCPYCPFKCGRCSTIVRHVRRKHRGRPLNAIQRKIYPRSSANGFEINSNGMQSGKPKGKTAVSKKLRGPRSVKESHAIEWGTRVWECPFCGRRSLFKGSVKVHIKVAHPSEDSEVKVQHLPRAKPDWNSTTAVSRKAVIDIVPIESMHLYDSLGTLLLDNGTSLKYDLDVDDDVDDNRTVVDRTGLRYQCSHCSFRNQTPQVIKIHILQVHPGESVTLLDHLSGYRSRHLILCNNTDCCFATSKVDKLKIHVCKLTETEKPKAAAAAARGNGLNGETPVRAQDISEMESQLSGISFRSNTQCDDQRNMDDDDVILSVPNSNASKSMDILSSESQHSDSLCFFSGNFRKRINAAEGPIDYNDDGTLKGVDFENGSITLQCQYCDCPKTSDPVEVKAHLASEHPQLQPVAVDVDLKEKGEFSYLFICSVFGCNYSSRFSNVFEHHMNVEHPDVEGVRLVRKKCTQKRSVSEKFQLQDEVPIVEENTAQNALKLTDDFANRAPLPTAAIASPAAFSPSTLSPIGILGSDCSSAVGDSPAVGSPDAIQISDSPFSTEDAVRPGRKSRKRNKYVDFACRYECIQCSFRIGSPEEMKGHLVAKHHENFRNFYCIDRRARQLRKRQKIIFCRESRCRFYCKFNEELENHEKYTCSFSPSVRPHHRKAAQERLLQYMDSVVKTNPRAPGTEGEKSHEVSGGSAAVMLDDVNNKMYQCSHCTFITTDLHNIRMHVIAEHASTEGGFTEIKTELGTDGNVVMNVNDRGIHRLSRSAADANPICVRKQRSTYDVSDTVKADNEEKVYTVL